MIAVNNTGVMICGHGSREADTIREFMALADDVAARLPEYQVESGFLELASPSIQDGLEKLRQAGCANILVIPGTLFSGGHAMQDIPSILKNFVTEFPDIQIRYGRAFDVDANFIGAACARLRAASGSVAPDKTALLVAGRGASDPEVIASMQAVTRLIQAEMNFAHVATAYAGIALPTVPDALQRIADRVFQRVIVLPYFLFTGMLVKRIYDETDAVAAQYLATQFVKAHYLNNHPLIIDSFVERIRETHVAGTLING